MAVCVFTQPYKSNASAWDGGVICVLIFGHVNSDAVSD